jgi:hypothetical protein
LVGWKAGLADIHDWQDWQILMMAGLIEPPVEPARQVGDAVGSRKTEPAGQLPKRRLGVAAAEPGRDRPRCPRPSISRLKTGISDQTALIFAFPLALFAP